ncbi:hypothetical protein BD779DRAFT_1785442 [Infundibulicybe gibba]|nr:hypothetical protein BD779DRAFT_1785442 [Infundibulicybe gibba]
MIYIMPTPSALTAIAEPQFDPHTNMEPPMADTDTAAGIDIASWSNTIVRWFIFWILAIFYTLVMSLSSSTGCSSGHLDWSTSLSCPAPGLLKSQSDSNENESNDTQDATLAEYIGLDQTSVDLSSIALLLLVYVVMIWALAKIFFQQFSSFCDLAGPCFSNTRSILAPFRELKELVVELWTDLFVAKEAVSLSSRPSFALFCGTGMYEPSPISPSNSFNGRHDSFISIDIASIVPAKCPEDSYFEASFCMNAISPQKYQDYVLGVTGGVSIVLDSPILLGQFGGPGHLDQDCASSLDDSSEYSSTSSYLRSSTSSSDISGLDNSPPPDYVTNPYIPLAADPALPAPATGSDESLGLDAGTVAQTALENAILPCNETEEGHSLEIPLSLENLLEDASSFHQLKSGAHCRFSVDMHESVEPVLPTVRSGGNGSTSMEDSPSLDIASLSNTSNLLDDLSYKISNSRCSFSIDIEEPPAPAAPIASPGEGGINSSIGGLSLEIGSIRDLSSLIKDLPSFHQAMCADSRCSFSIDVGGLPRLLGRHAAQRGTAMADIPRIQVVSPETNRIRPPTIDLEDEGEGESVADASEGAQFYERLVDVKLAKPKSPKKPHELAMSPNAAAPPMRYIHAWNIMTAYKHSSRSPSWDTYRLRRRHQPDSGSGAAAFQSAGLDPTFDLIARDTIQLAPVKTQHLTPIFGYKYVKGYEIDTKRACELGGIENTTPNRIKAITLAPEMIDRDEYMTTRPVIRLVLIRPAPRRTKRRF